MNTKAFAVAAVFGASAALAGECPDAADLPSNFNELGWREQAIQKFIYMDSCPQDNKLSYAELKRYSDEVPEGLMQPHDPDSDQDQVYGAMARMDSDQKSYVSFEDYLRRAQIEAQPITEDYDEDEKFDYLSCKPQANENDESANCGESYDRADLRSTIWMLQDIDHVFDGVSNDNVDRLTAYEVYINKEFRLRDYNSDGQIDREEHDRHNRMKETMIDLYHQALQDSLSEEQHITRAGYENLGDEHPFLHYHDAETAFTLLDINYDQMLTFDEVWYGTQLDDIIWRRFSAVCDSIDLDGDEKVTQQEILAYVAGRFEGAQTSDQVKAMAEEMFWKYNHSSAEHDGQQVVEKQEAWLVVAKEDHAMEKREMRLKDLKYLSKKGWIKIDEDHDDIITVQDLTGAIDHATIVDLYELLGKDTVTDSLSWEDVFEDFVLREFHGFQALERDWMAVIHEGEPSYTFTLEQLTDPEALAHFQKTQEEMEQYFNIMDKNSDGLVDGEEACRYWIGDHEILCGKFAPEYQNHWLNMVWSWVYDPLGNH